MLNYSVPNPPPDGELPAEIQTEITWTEEPVRALVNQAPLSRGSLLSSFEPPTTLRVHECFFQGNGEYEVTLDYPDEGYRAFYIRVLILVNLL